MGASTYSLIRSCRTSTLRVNIVPDELADFVDESQYIARKPLTGPRSCRILKGYMRMQLCLMSPTVDRRVFCGARLTRSSAARLSLHPPRPQPPPACPGKNESDSQAPLVERGGCGSRGRHSVARRRIWQGGGVVLRSMGGRPPRPHARGWRTGHLECGAALLGCVGLLCGSSRPWPPLVSGSWRVAYVPCYLWRGGWMPWRFLYPFGPIRFALWRGQPCRRPLRVGVPIAIGPSHAATARAALPCGVLGLGRRSASRRATLTASLLTTRAG